MSMGSGVPDIFAGKLQQDRAGADGDPGENKPANQPFFSRGEEEIHGG